MQDFDIELPELPEEFERDWQELLKAEECQPCDVEECPYQSLCQYVRASRGEA